MEEKNEVKCKKCGEIKMRIQKGNYNDKHKSKRWVGIDDKLWMGKTCPECNLIRCKDNMKEMRSKNKNV